MHRASYVRRKVPKLAASVEMYTFSSWFCVGHGGIAAWLHRCPVQDESCFLSFEYFVRRFESRDGTDACPCCYCVCVRQGVAMLRYIVQEIL